MDIVTLRRINLRAAIDAAIASGKFSNDAEFANHYEISPSQISQLVKGHGSFGEKAARNLEKKIGWETGLLDAIPSALNHDTAPKVTTPNILDQKKDNVIEHKSNVSFNSKPLRQIPLLDYVQAGLFHEVGYDGVHPLGISHTTYENAKPECVFSLKVEGLSMSPDFMPGDEVVVDASLAAKPGSLVIAQEVKHGVAQTTFKKYRQIGINEFGVDVIELVPLNPDFPTLNSMQIEISIIGVVVAHNRIFKY